MSKLHNTTTIWPTQFALVDVENASPIGSIWVVAKSGRGKSSFAASIPAQNPLVLDLEGSYTTLRFLTKMTRIDLREKAQALPGDNFQLKLFQAFLGILEAIKPGQHDVIVIDPYSDLYFGSFFWVGENAAVFGKTPQRYNGEQGQMAQWADARVYWKELVSRLEALCQTVVFTSHPKDVWDKKTKLRTGEQTFRGADITEAVSLKLWLFDDRDPDPQGRKPGEKGFAGCNWAFVDKNRLSWHYYKTKNTKVPRLLPILPKKLVPAERGQTAVELIYQYMSKPAPDYGELDQVVGDPTASPMSDIETRLALQDAQETELKIRLSEAKREMATRLIEGRYFSDANAIAEAIMALNLDQEVQELAKMESVEKALREYVDEAAFGTNAMEELIAEAADGR